MITYNTKGTCSRQILFNVDENGLLTAHAEGTAVITCVASGGDVDDCTVTVKPGPFAITLPESAVTLYENGRRKLVPEIEGGSGKYTLYSLDESILTIDPETLEIAAIRSGEAYVLFLTPNYLIAECLVTILDAPEVLTLSAAETVFAVGESTSLSMNLSGYPPLEASYTTDSPAVIKLDADGTVTGKAPGKAVVTVSVGGLQASEEIEVQPIASSIRLTASKDLLGEGETMSLTSHLTGGAGRVKYTSNDPAVASVDPESGFVTAVREGLCIITASLVNGVESSLTVRVAPAPTEFALGEEAIVLGTNDAHLLLYSFNSGASASVSLTWDSPEMLRFENGLLLSTGVPGTCTLLAETHNGLTDRMTVTVKSAPEAISASASPLSMHEEFEGFVQLNAKDTHNLNAYCEGYFGQLFTYVSSHPEIASVSEDGTVTAHKSGTALITVSLLSGAKTDILFIVS